MGVRKFGVSSNIRAFFTALRTLCHFPALFPPAMPPQQCRWQASDDTHEAHNGGHVDTGPEMVTVTMARLPVHVSYVCPTSLLQLVQQCTVVELEASPALPDSKAYAFAIAPSNFSDWVHDRYSEVDRSEKQKQNKKPSASSKSVLSLNIWNSPLKAPTVSACLPN